METEGTAGWGPHAWTIPGIAREPQLRRACVTIK